MLAAVMNFMSEAFKLATSLPFASTTATAFTMRGVRSVQVGSQVRSAPICATGATTTTTTATATKKDIP